MQRSELYPTTIKRFLLWIGAMALLLLQLAGCGGNANLPDGEGNYSYRVQLTTTAGTQPYTGSLIVTKADGQIEITNVEGTAPHSYTLKGVQVDLTFSKAVASGQLKVTLLRGGNVLAEGETSAAFGTISVSGR